MGKIGRPREYLRIKDFNDFVENHFATLQRHVWYLLGAVAVLIPVVIAILMIVAS